MILLAILIYCTIVSGQQFITITLPTETATQFVTQTQSATGTYTTITTTETKTPTYFEDQNVITQDIVTVISIVAIILIAIYITRQQAWNKKQKQLDLLEAKKDQIINTLDNVIPITN